MSDSNPLVIQAGQTVRFPVASSDPLAQYQQLKAVSEVASLNDLAIARSLVALSPSITSLQLSDAVNSFLTGHGTSQIVVLDFPVDITVQAGATMVFSGPVTTLSVRNFYVDGTVTAQGSLNITCSGAFGASPPAASGGGSPSGGLPPPGKAPKPGPILTQ
jgi:hypothetical protein